MAEASTPPGPRMSPIALKPSCSFLRARRLFVEAAYAGAAMQLARHVFEGDVARGQPDQRVEEQIGRFGDDALLRSGGKLRCQFIGFFANLLANESAAVEQRLDVRLGAL